MRRRGNIRVKRTNNNSIKLDTKLKKTIIPIGVFLLFLIIFSVIFSLFNIGNKKIVKGVKIENIDVAGYTQDEAIEKINKWKEEKCLKDITLKYGDYEKIIGADQISPEIDTDKIVRDALNVGNTGNIIKDNYDILFSMLFSKKIDIKVSINDEEFNKIIKEINGELPNTLEDSNYYIEGKNLIIKKGKEGIIVNEKEFKDLFYSALLSDNKEMNLPVETKEPRKINIEEIYKEIHKEKQNAYISDNPIEVHSEVNGVDFEKSLEEVKSILNEEKEEYVIPLKITLAETTIEDLGKEAFPNLLGTFSTTYNTENTNRVTNLKLASEKIDGTIILPGETFSYNKVVGQRTIAAGYKEAAVYSGGKVVDGIGGGICQISSTLYNAAVYANLEITERSNHRFFTSYIEAGRDATVSWGTVDLCFVNTRKYPIKVTSSVKNGVVTLSIYGIREENEYEVVIENKIDELIPFPVKYVKDNTMDEGTEEIKQFGSNGARSTTYKILTSNGMIVSKELLSEDTYSPLERIILKGTKKTEQTSAQIFATSREDENEEQIIEGLNPGLLDLIQEL